MKLIPDPAPAKPDDRSVYVPGARWRPDPWGGKPIRGMGALHAAREFDRCCRRERRLAWKLAWRMRGRIEVRRNDGTTYRSLIGDYAPRETPLAYLCALLLAPLARQSCRHDYRVDHAAIAQWGFSAFYEGGGSWRELLVPLRILSTRSGRFWIAVPRGLPEIVSDST